jgi:hypothetical protein
LLSVSYPNEIVRYSDAIGGGRQVQLRGGALLYGLGVSQTIVLRIVRNSDDNPENF